AAADRTWRQHRTGPRAGRARTSAGRADTGSGRSEGAELRAPPLRHSPPGACGVRAELPALSHDDFLNVRQPSLYPRARTVWPSAPPAGAATGSSCLRRQATEGLSHGCRTAARTAMNVDPRHERGQRAAGLHLRQLLLRPGPYRDRWERLARDARPGEIRQDAVCQVIADWLQDTGERGDTDTGLARTLKDRVSRALGGRGLSLETL